MNPHPYIVLHPQAGSATRRYLRLLVAQFLHFHFDTMQTEGSLLDPLRPELRMVTGRDLVIWLDGEPAVRATAAWQARLLTLALKYEQSYPDEQAEGFRAAIAEMDLPKTEIREMAHITLPPCPALAGVDANEFMRASLELDLTATGAIILTDYVNFLTDPDAPQRLIPDRYLDRGEIKRLLDTRPLSHLPSP